MRSKLAMKNMVANLFLQVLVLISGIILPRFFMETYGSTVNGMITSVNQFLMYLGLAEAGIGTASVVALYAPLAHEQEGEVNSILSATRKFYNRSGSLFLVFVLLLAVVYPFFISGQLEQSMVRTMVLVLASSTLVDFFFLGKYRVLLTANQRGYVVAVIQSVGTVVNMAVSILLIYLEASVLIVKAVATGVYILRLLLVRIYVKKEYPNVDFHAEPKMDALNQRGAALLHQIVGIIVNNTDVVLLTILIGRGSLLEVSVYSSYNLVVTAVNTLLTSFSNGLTAGFGEVISKGEEDVLRENYSSYEYMYLVILFIVVVCMGVLIIPFIAVYTMNMTDVDYVRPLIGVLFTVIVLLQNIRIPGITIICAAGHYKETRYQAIIEAVINLVVSIALIQKLGMAGVLIGTVCSYGYRSLDVILYNSKYLVKGTGKRTFSRIGRNIFVVVVLVAVGIYVVPQNMTSFVSWFLYAVLSGAVSSFVLLGLNYFAEPEECRKLLVKFKMVVK